MKETKIWQTLKDAKDMYMRALLWQKKQELERKETTPNGGIFHFSFLKQELVRRRVWYGIARINNISNRFLVFGIICCLGTFRHYNLSFLNEIKSRR